MSLCRLTLIDNYFFLVYNLPY